MCREGAHPGSQSISRDKTPRRSAASTAAKSDLNKYRALPPISSSSKTLVKPGTAHTEATITEEIATVLEPTPPESFNLILTIKARSYTVDEFRAQFNGYETFYFDKKMYTSVVQQATSVDEVRCLISCWVISNKGFCRTCEDALKE